MNLNKDEELLIKRLKELSLQSYNRGVSTFTDFLNLNEQNLFYSVERNLASKTFVLWGGHEDSERKMIAFLCERDYDTVINQFNYELFPIICIKITPCNAKYSDTFTHRDYLGAILNLGIERGKIGDILIQDNIGHVFCNPTIGTFIVDHLYKIKHTSVHCEISQQDNIDIKPSLKELHGTVSSIRLDSILSLAFNTSRSSLTGLISGGKVFVNGKLILSNSYTLKEGDVVSVRGLGKFIYKETSHQTKKGRYSVSVLKY